MRTMYRIALSCIAVAAICLVAPMAQGAGKSLDKQVADSSAVHFPFIQLHHWKNTPAPERHAFLAGFVSMLELERLWQGPNALPVNRSVVGTWVKGLSNVTLRDMDASLNQYIKTHPNDMDKSVLEILGLVYVRPKLSMEEQKMAGDRCDALKADFPNL